MSKKQNFIPRIQNILDKYPLISCKPSLSVNELAYALRMESEDYSISDDRGSCIPSVKKTFIPTSILSRPIKSIEWDEEINAMSDTKVVCITYDT